MVCLRCDFQTSQKAQSNKKETFPKPARPFPNSLMLGCIALATSDDLPVLEDKELDDAQWFSKDEVLESLEFNPEKDIRTEGTEGLDGHGGKKMPKFWMPPGYVSILVV